MTEPDASENVRTEGAPGVRPLSEGASTVRHEEELEIGVQSREVGAVHARKRVESERVSEVVPRFVEHLDEFERAEPNDGDSGEVEVLPDGSVSIPVLEEELVITRRTVVRERVIVRKRTETEHQRIEVELRKERVEIDADAGIELAD